MRLAEFQRDLEALTGEACSGKPPSKDFYRRFKRLCEEEPIFAERIAALLEPRMERILHMAADLIASGKTDDELTALWPEAMRRSFS